MSRRPLAPLALVLAAAALLASAGCRSSGAASGGDGGGRPAAKAQEEPSGPKGPGALDYAATVPENVVYLPWKLVGGAMKGASDGVQAGFANGRMPTLGLLFSPVNLVTGFVTGIFQGAALDPGLVGPEDSFGRAMAAPTKMSTSIWWYP